MISQLVFFLPHSFVLLLLFLFFSLSEILLFPLDFLIGSFFYSKNFVPSWVLLIKKKPCPMDSGGVVSFDETNPMVQTSLCLFVSFFFL